MERQLRQALRTGSFKGVSPTRSRTMRAIKGRGNKTTELTFRMILVRRRVSGWMMHPAEIPGHPDFYFPACRTAIFLDGCFWHGCKKCGHIPRTNRAYWLLKILKNRERDRDINKRLAQLGIAKIRIWEHELQAIHSKMRPKAREKLEYIFQQRLN